VSRPSAEAVAAARRTLAPSLEEALAAWRTLVIGDREQVEALPDRPRPEDYYAPVAEAFRADPRRADEPVLDYLRSLVQPGEAWLDLGAGGGRYTLPLALRAARVIAIEPSEGMRRVLAGGMAEHDIENIEVYDERWPGPSRAPVADVGFMSHVGYDIEEIGPFLDQLEAHSRRLCLCVLLERAPTSEFAALWGPVHGEPRVLLPGLREFVNLLFARGSVPEVRAFQIRPRLFPDLATLQAASRRFLWVREGSEADARLGEAVRALAKPLPGGFVLSERPRNLGVVAWAPLQRGE
jgi:SAM-dependent methyltransferase